MPAMPVFSLSHAAWCATVQEIITVGQSSPKLVDCYVHKVCKKYFMCAIKYKTFLHTSLTHANKGLSSMQYTLNL